MLRGMNIWLPGYIGSLARRPHRLTAPRHLLFAICDHFEPYRDRADMATARSYVERWHTSYPAVVDSVRDSTGRPPRHTFFYPAEEADTYSLNLLGTLTQAGYGEVEIHLHHRHDTPAGLRDKLTTFRDRLRYEHGMLGSIDGQPAYAFVHGNWSLCNSRPDGDWCGVNEELGILAQTGCYADLTFPSAPSPTQPRTVNTIYRATDNPNGRGHDYGTPLRAAPSGRPATAQGLLIIQGPLALNIHRRKYGLLPRIENGELSGSNPPAPDRIDLWSRTAIHVRGRPEWVFVKLHTHGCVPANTGVLLGDATAAMHRYLQAHFNDGHHWQLHYVTAREMANVILAAEEGHSGNPAIYLDHHIAPPPGIAT